MTSENFNSSGTGSDVAYGYLEAEFTANLGQNDGGQSSLHFG